MALIIEAVGRSGVTERVTVDGGRGTINAQPGITYRVLDENRHPVDVNATVRRVGDNLIVEGLPDDTTLQFTDFFFVCTPDNPCALDLAGLGGAPGETIGMMSEPVAALADGSFVMHTADPGSTPVAPESEFSAKPALAGLALLAAAGAGGGGSGGGDKGPPPPPPGSTTVTSPEATSDSTPTITGTAPAGTQVTVTLDIPGHSLVTFSTVADGNGQWSIDTGTSPTIGSMPAGGLPVDEPTTVRVLSSGSSQPIEYTLRMDLVPPAAPAIRPVTGDDVINADEARTNDHSPIAVEGTLEGEAGATVTVTWAGQTGTAVVDGSGNWQVVFDGQEIPDGSYAITAVATDVAGNVGAAGTRDVLVQTGRPSKPAIDEVTGDNIINRQESDTGVTLTGTTTAGTDVFVTFGSLAERPATTSGTAWSLAIGAADLATLADGGSYQVTAYASDGVNRSANATEAFTVDRTPPAAPSITIPVAGDNLVNAAEAAGGVTVNGTGGEVGGTVQVTWGSVTLAPVNVGADGSWTAVFGPGQLPAADSNAHTVRAVALDPAKNESQSSAEIGLALDRTSPTPVITDNFPGATTSEPVTFSFNFGEAVTGFTADDVTVVGGSKGAFAGSGSTYTLVVTPTPGDEGTITVGVPAGAATDTAGNPSLVATQHTQGFDTKPPTLVIGDTFLGPTATEPVTFTFTFSEAVTGFTAGDVIVAGGTKGAFDGSGNAYTLVVTPTPNANGTIAVDVPAGVATDIAGNPNMAAAQHTQAFDTRQPSLVITDDVSEPTATGLVTFTFTFSEAVTGFTASDVTVAGGTKGVFDGSGTTYTLAVTPTPNTDAGTITVSVPAGAATSATGNPNLAAGPHTQAFDTKPPTLIIEDNFSEDTATGAVIFTFEFSEPVTGFTASEINVIGGTKGTFSGGGDTYTLTVIPTPNTDDGVITVNVPAGAASDTAGNLSLAAGPHTQAFDTKPPTLIIGDSFSGPTANEAVTFTFEFSEAVTGFDASKIVVTDGTKGVFNGSGSSYTLVVEPPPNDAGTIKINVAAGAAQDAAGNASLAADEHTQGYNTIEAGAGLWSDLDSGGMMMKSLDADIPDFGFSDDRTLSIERLVDDSHGTPGVEVANGGMAGDTTPVLTLHLSDLLGEGESVRLVRDGMTVATTDAPGQSWELVDAPGIGSPGPHTYTAELVSGGAVIAVSDPQVYLLQMV